jgi:hypothetical protein
MNIGRVVPVALIGAAAMAFAIRADADILVNNPATDTSTTCCFTQSETSVLVFGSTVLVGFNDSGSFFANTNKFTGYARSTDGGLTFTDMGTLPTNTLGDAGDPHLVRNSTTGTIYMTTLAFSGPGNIQLFRSTDGGLTFTAPVNATPGVTFVDYSSTVVDNYAGGGNGNVYVATRIFSGAQGIELFRSTDGGLTFGPNGGVLLPGSIGNNSQGPSVMIAPDHSVHVTWYEGLGLGTERIVTAASTDGGLTFSAPVTIATLSTSGVNGDLGLLGIRSNTGFASSFRSNAFPQVAVDPITGYLYATFDNDPTGPDKGDIYLSISTDNGLTWTSPVRVNTDGTTNDQWQPTLAVTPDGLHLGVFWYDRSLDPANNLIDYFGRICDIGAGGTLTCGAEFRVSDVSFLPEFGRDSVLNSVYMGDYDIPYADNFFFYVAWGDNLLPLGTSGKQDPNVFFDRIAIPGGGTAPEPATLLLVALGLAGLAASRPRTQ